MLDQGLFITTDLFEVTTPGAHFINARCFGEDFAAWLRAQYVAGGIDVSEPIQEDWGWALFVKIHAHTFTVSIGVMDESIGVLPAEWRVGVTYEKTLNGIRSWFKSPPIDLFNDFFARIRTIVSSEPRFRVADTESS